MNIFISYNSQSTDLADLMKIKLEQEKFQVWKDTADIQPGTEWRNEIDKGLKSCDVVIVILNQYSTQSAYVTYEWAFALGNQKEIIPILTEDCKIHPRIETIQYFDFKEKKRPWEKLIERIRQLSPNNKTNSSNKIKRVADLTVYELERLITGSKRIASEYANSQGRGLLDEDIVEVANKIVNAKSVLEENPVDNNTILWVDDNPDNNIYERESLELIGFKFDLALSTDEALAKLKDNKYAAIISDMGRREGTSEGYALLKVIRKTDKKTPYFIYASSNSLEHKIQAQERGAQGATNNALELIDFISFQVQS